MKRFFVSAIAGLMAVSAVNAQHYALSPEWVAGEGVYVIAEEDGNRFLSAAAVNGADPKHAWVRQNFGDTYTVRCDVRMDSWVDDADLSRAGIAAQITPNGSLGEDRDRGINLLFHHSTTNVEFLNDLRAWADDTEFAWSVDTWYRFELTITGGTTASGSVTNLGNPSDTVDLVPWEIPDPQNRANGLAGVTASTAAGLVASYDNFEVEVGGSVVFSDDFEGTPPVPSAPGVGPNWQPGLAGYYVIDDGVLYSIATTGADPKHIWYKNAIQGGAQISADVTMLSWADGQDLSRAGVAVHIQPNGSAPDGDRDRGINLLFHQDLGNVEYLNDLRAWATDESFDWTTGTTYRFNLESDGTTVNGSVDDFALAPWDFPDPQNRANGFAGLTPSTLRGLVASFDNVEIRDGNGNVIFTDDFEAFQTSNTEGWELYQ